MRLTVYLRGWGNLLVFPFLVQEENNVGSVGSVAQSKKSPQKIPVDSFQKGLHSLHRLHQ
jgi:hypothetical protein